MFITKYTHIYHKELNNKIHAIEILIFPALFDITDINNERKYVLLVTSLHYLTI